MEHVFPSDLVVENKVARRLRRVLACLEDQRLAGWCKRAPKNVIGQTCLEEALRLEGGGLDSPAADLVRQVIGQRDIWVWNDSPKTTFNDVRAVILEAVRRAECGL
jgi:hypothetical protein